MTRRLLYAVLAGGLCVAALTLFFSLSAAAVDRTFLVRLPTGEVITVTVDAPAGVPMSAIPGLPGTPIQEITPPGGGGGGGPSLPSVGGGGGGGGGSGGGGGGGSGGGAQRESQEPSSSGGSDEPSTSSGERQEHSGSRRRAGRDEANGQSGDEGRPRRRRRGGRSSGGGGGGGGTPLRRPDGTPTLSNPGLMDALPGPSPRGVPNFVIRKFRVPIFLLPIYQAAGIQYGVRWEILAAINEIETDYGRNLNVSSAGALGWMQFLPSTWRQWGVDGNHDKKKDPYNPVDAIFAAARYLKAAGYEDDVRRSIFAYNHADWYVDSVLLRARLIAGIPSDLVGSLTGLTEGRFPVAARARYADDINEREAQQRIEHGQNASREVATNDDRRGIDIFSQRGAPIVAVNDGVIKRIGRSASKGLFIELQDVYGNRYRYSGLGSISRLYPVPKQDTSFDEGQAKAIAAHDEGKPTQPASAGRQVSTPGGGTRRAGTDSASQDEPRPTVTYKQRLFAHPYRPNALTAGGLDQIFDAQMRNEGGFENYQNYFVRGLGLNAKNATLKPLKRGARVVAGTILGRIGRPDATKAPHLTFEIRPAGRGAPSIDPKPILDGWKLLESTAIYRSDGRNVLYGDDGDGFSIGQILLLPKPLLEKRVLSDPRVDIYPCGRSDIRTGQIDRRVLATLEYLSESGLRPTVTSLRCGHGTYTSSGNVSEHSSGNAVDIARVNGTPILGHQRGEIGETAVKRLMMLQGTMEPHQIISLLNFGRNTYAMGDHNDHIHVGFRPLFGDNRKLGSQARAILKPGQWEDLIDRLRDLPNPVVRPRPSRYAIPAHRSRRASRAHRGD